MRGPCCSSDARGDTGGLQYRAASTRRRRSGCAGLLARFRRHCRRAAPSILRGRPLPRWTKEPASGRRVTWPPPAAAGQKARAPRDTASRRMKCPAAVPMPAAIRAGCSTELLRLDGGALGARAFWPASARKTPPRSGDHCHQGAGLRPARDLAAFGGSGPEGPRTQRYGVAADEGALLQFRCPRRYGRVAVQSCLDSTAALWVRGPSGPLQETLPARSAVHTPRPTAAAVDQGAGLRPARDLAAFGGSGPEGPRTPEIRRRGG